MPTYEEFSQACPGPEKALLDSSIFENKFKLHTLIEDLTFPWSIRNSKLICKALIGQSYG